MPSHGASVLLDYLPAIYKDPGWAGGPSAGRFLNDFLLAFEHVLIGRPHSTVEPGSSRPFLSRDPRAPVRFQGLEEKVAQLAALFDAWRTPAEFLDWLAGWAALSFCPELSEQQKRQLIANIIPLYRIRGTKRYLERLIDIFLGGKSMVDDHAYPGMQIARYSTVSKDTYLGGSSPHYFRVRIAVSAEQRHQIDARRRLARQVIDQAKPAHTYYDLEIVTPRLQVKVHSRVGVDTFLVSSSEFHESVPGRAPHEKE
jgi:phage tail-like protein